MVNAIFDHIVAILIVGAIFVGAVVVLPSISLSSMKAVDQQQIKNTALNVFNTILLDEGQPSDWGNGFGTNYDFQMDDPRVTRFGLSKTQEAAFYVLDPDKVQRLVYENPTNYLTYERTRQLLGLQDYGFRIRIIPPFNVTLNTSLTMTGSAWFLNYYAKVIYLAGDPIPNAKAEATIVYTWDNSTGIGPHQDKTGNFAITKSGSVNTNVLGVCEGTVRLLGRPKYNFTMTALRVTVADVATMIVKSATISFQNTVANINLVHDTIFLTGVKNVTTPRNCWIYNIVAFDSQGDLWSLLNTTDDTKAPNFNTGGSEFNMWTQQFLGLDDFEPILLVFRFRAYLDTDTDKSHGRDEVLVVVAYPDLFGTNIFEYGGTPSKGTAIVNIQRSVIISRMTYTAELWLWKT